MFFRDAGLGFKMFGKAFVFLFKHNLWYYLVFPLLIWLLLVWLNLRFADTIMDFFSDILCYYINCPEPETAADNQSWLDVAWAWGKDALNWTARLAIRLSIGIYGLLITKYLTLILLSPVLAMLSEATEEKLTGNTYPFSFKRLLIDTGRGIMIALRNFLIEFGPLAIIWFASWLFGVPWLLQILTIPLWFLGWYFIGFSMLDYVNERRRLKIRQSVRFVRKHKGLAIAIGWIYAVILWVTDTLTIGWVGLGAIGLMFAPILACVASVLAVHELEDLSKNPYAVKKVKDA